MATDRGRSGSRPSSCLRRADASYSTFAKTFRLLWQLVYAPLWHSLSRTLIGMLDRLPYTARAFVCTTGFRPTSHSDPLAFRSAQSSLSSRQSVLRAMRSFFLVLRFWELVVVMETPASQAHVRVRWVYIHDCIITNLP